MNHRTAPLQDLTSGASAARLRDAVAADPAGPVVVGVQGAGGYGKTALLVSLAEIYREAGVRVVNGAAERLDAVGSGAAVVVDDAHRASDSTLHELTELARRPSARLFVTYRPWPRRPALSALVEELGRSRPPILLGALGPREVAEYSQNVLGATVAGDAVERLLTRTGGVPRLVARVLAGTREGGNGRLPASVLDQFQHDLDQLGETGRLCLTALAAGAAPHPELLASLLDLDHSEAVAGMSAVRAGGLTDQADVLLPVVREATSALVPWDRRLTVFRRLIEINTQRGRPVLDLVRPLLDTDVGMVAGPLMAEAFEQAADEALRSAPALAGRCLQAALDAGARPERLTARRARAALEAGAFDDALRLADEALVAESSPDRGLGARVAATVLAHRGLLGRSAELCRWSVQGARWPGDHAFAVVGLIGSGRRDEAAELLRSSDDTGPPTSLSGAVAQLAAGVHESVAGSAVTAVSTLVRSASLAEPAGRSILVPDSPAALGSIVAMHAGEFDVAESLLARGIEAGVGGELLAVRHRLLAAWVPLLRGDTVTARARLDLVQVEPAQARDRLLTTALEAGIAGRDNNVPALTTVRGRIRQVVAEHPVDLFTLLPLGELIVAAARLRDHEWIEPHRRDATTLLDQLGNPPLWTCLLEWRCLHASIVLDDLHAVRRHAEVLAANAHHNPMAAAMGAAATTWVRLLSGTIDQDEVESAARALHAAGLAADGARLAGQAALRTADRGVMLALLDCARTLQGKPSRPRAIPAGEGGDAVLSDREKEVAELVVAGHTYKQVGQRLFISAKTVEHHMGRMKQRLGCGNREELLQRLRDLLGRGA